MSNDDLRDGEIAVTLPETFDAGVHFIGRIRTPWARREDCPKNARGSDAVCRLELDPRYEAALSGLAGHSHLIVLYFMDQARRDLLVQRPRKHIEPRGSFSIRSPVRPNPIALSVARLVGIEGTALSVVGLDCRDGTPLVDIKPYLPAVDSVPDAIAPPRK